MALSAIEVPAYEPPTWPEPGVPKQIHLDLAVSDLATAVAESQRLGATRDLVNRGVVPGLIGYLDGSPAGWISLGAREE